MSILTNSTITVSARYLVFLLLGWYGVVCYAQNQTSEKVHDALNLLLNDGAYQKAEQTISSISNDEISSMPDSVKLDYHYALAAIADFNENKEKELYHLQCCKSLCEHSQGIHSPVYVEIVWALGQELEAKGDTINAFYIYQAALIQSVGLYSLRDPDVEWQYNDMQAKVIAWYKNRNLRRQMITNRNSLYKRYSNNNDAQIINDKEFYLYYQDRPYWANKIQQADNLMEKQNYQEALFLYNEVYNATEDNFVAKATVGELIAMNCINLGDFNTAEKILLENIQLLSDNKCQQTKTYRRSLSSLSIVYIALYNYTRAKEFAGEAKFWFEHCLDFSKAYIVCLHRCAALENGNQNYFLAMLLEDVAMQELYKNYSESSVEFNNLQIDLLSSSSLFYDAMGFVDESMQNIALAINVAEKIGINATPYYHNLASIALQNNRFDEAYNASKIAYDLCKNSNEMVSEQTILVGLQYLLISKILKKDTSPNIALELSENIRKNIQEVFCFLSSEERYQYWSTLENSLPTLNWLIYDAMDETYFGTVYNNLLVTKNLLLRTNNEIRDAILQSGDTISINNYRNMLQYRSIAAHATDSMSRMNFLKEADLLDKQLTRKFSVYSNKINYEKIQWQDIQEALTSEDVSIEFCNIPIALYEGNSIQDWSAESRYCAVILKKEYKTPKIIPLCKESTLLSIDNIDYYLTDSIYNLIWKPIEKEFNGIKNIYFSADGELHKIGIEYAMFPDGTYINDKYNIYRLSSTSKLVDKRKRLSSFNSVLFGGLKYSLEPDELIAASRSSDSHRTHASRSADLSHFRYGVNELPGTLVEVETISEEIRSCNYGNCKVITGVSGTEEEFRSLAGGNMNIIHLATHGYYWSEEEAKKRNYVNFLSQINTQDWNVEDKALLRSGLFFSGVNIGLQGGSLPDDVEDGVLTAQELSTMNLGAVDMVIMSACQSGLGETTGEGVFGLQRGFKLAGANTLLMSLWKVDDNATCLLMTEFYKNYLGGESKHDALYHAQLKLRSNPEFADPEYWAGFIMLDGLNPIE